MLRALSLCVRSRQQQMQQLLMRTEKCIRLRMKMLASRQRTGRRWQGKPECGLRIGGTGQDLTGGWNACRNGQPVPGQKQPIIKPCRKTRSLRKI